MDVGDWLRSLGLGQYDALFRENEIDAEVLFELTDADLEKFGVPFGHRKRLLKAIAKLGTAAPRLPEEPPAPPQPPPQRDAERRHLAVLFCDLVGSTGISAALDAEDWRDLVGGYLDAASEAVAQLGGHVAKKLGDGIMALFGHPVAQENDSERAVRAALAIQLALAELNRKNLGSVRPELVARIGIAAGAVVVDSSGEIFGDAPNIAARVQALAEPGMVLITARVQRQVAGLFVAEDRGAHALKGVAEPTTLYRIVRASGAGRRSGQRALTPLIGREEEVTMLLRRWERARQGEGQFVQIVGEPGLGKSRLIEEFHARLAETPHSWAEWSSSQLLQNTPLHPIADWGRQRFGGADVAPERRLADLESTLAQVKLDPAEYVPLLAPLVDIPLPPERASALAPEELRRRQMVALLAWVMAGARTQPVVLAFEDLHWADPTTLDLMRGFAERGALAPLLVIATTRPEFRAPWGARSHHGTITLAPLDRAQVRQMVGELAQRHALSRDVIDGVSERTGGVPLFVEEVTRLLLERGEQGGAQAIPPTLAQSLAARLDRLGPAREVAMIGAVLGRGFSYPLLRAVAGLEDSPLQQALEKLAEADILLVEGLPPDAEYRFKHALIQDAAYENLLKSRRLALHRRAAETLRDAFPERADAEPEALAHHFTQAGMNEEAIDYWGKAGDQALRRSAFQEAISHLGKAIEMADKGAGDTSTARGKVKLHVAYGNALIAARGHGAPETIAAFERAREAATRDQTAPERFSVRYGLWAGCRIRGELSAMREHAAAFLREVEARPQTPEAGVAHRVSGMTYWVAGDFVEARDHCEKALTIFDPARDGELAFQFGQDVGVAAMTNLAMSLWPLGEVERAAQLMQGAAARASGITHVGTLAYANMHAAMFEIVRREFASAAPFASALAELAREHDLEQWRAFGVFLAGWNAWRGNGQERGLAEMRRGLALLHEQNNVYFDGLYQCAFADAEAQSGDLEAALTALGEAIANSERTGLRYYDAELHRARGDILLKADPENPGRAEEAYVSAIAIAREQGARSFGLRAALWLAKLYQSTGRPAEAHDALAPALEGFLPTSEMPEIVEAQALLAELTLTDAVKADAAQRRQMTHFRVAYGNALIATHGFGAPETTEAFAKARESADGDNAAPERLAADYGLWVGSFVRGELPSMRTRAAALLRDVETRPDSPEASVAHRVLGNTHWFAGEYVEARDHLERALVLFQPGRDDDLAFRFGQDAGVAAMLWLTFTLWPLGEVERAVSLGGRAQARIAGLAHVGTHAFGKFHAAFFELIRGDLSRAAPSAVELARHSREHDLPMWRAYGVFLEGLATAECGAPVDGLEDMRRGVKLLRDQNLLMFDGLIKIALAEAEARAGDADRALAILDEALATSERIGHRAFEAELHRVRGEMLLERDPANPSLAEDAFGLAIEIAVGQGTRSFTLRAALQLAKLYQSTGRAADAHAVLAPALEGFSPTPEMPEIGEAEALLAALEETDEAKADAVQRRQRLHLQISYGKAVMWSRGYGAEETKAAFARAHELAVGIGNAAERFDVYYSQWAGCMVRGEPEWARTTAETFIRDAKNEGTPPDVAAAYRTAGRACLSQGDFSQARAHLEEALRTCDPEWDVETRRRHGTDCESSATAYLAHVVWQLGEVERARHLIDHATSRAVELGHIPTLANVYAFKTSLEMFRGDAQATLRDAETLVETAGKNGLAWFLNFGTVDRGWARARLSDRDAGMAEMREALGKSAEQGNWGFFPLPSGRLAELEAEGQGAEGALAHIDEALALAQRTGERWTDVFLHRIRGDILLKTDPENPARAEEAYLAAIAIAREQGARSFGLQAALKLAKLYQSTSRPVDAHAVLAPALEGFAPTPEMPEIAEAQTLIAALAETEEVKAAEAERQRRLPLHVAYGNALIAARGGGARETTEAFTRARESARRHRDAPERMAIHFGLWIGSYVRGELSSMRAEAAAFLAVTAANPDSPEAGVAHRVTGVTQQFAGEYVEARDHLEKALALFRPGRDDNLAFQFGQDVGISAMANLAHVVWPLGQIDRAIALVDQMQTRSAGLTHARALSFAILHAALFELMCADHSRGAQSAVELGRLAREHELTMYRSFGVFLEGWAKAGDGTPGGLEDMRRGADLLRDQNVLMFDGPIKIALAQAEAEEGNVDRAVAILDGALATCDRAGYRAFEAELHRVRGEMLLKRDLSDTTPAEEALQTAIAVAKQQGTRSFGLRAALSLARLYQAIGRPVEAHDVLAPALEGFSPTPEMQEIAEGEALLAALQGAAKLS